MKPKYTKFKKYHSPKLQEKFNSKNELIYSTYGIVSSEASFITGKQIESVNLTIKRTLKRRGKIIFRVFPHRSKTKKPLEVRMGKGKGNVATWLQPIRPGSVILELKTDSILIAKTALNSARHKLPFKTRLVLKDN